MPLCEDMDRTFSVIAQKAWLGLVVYNGPYTDYVGLLCNVLQE